MATKRQTELFIAIDMDGDTRVHIRGGISDYATACGDALDGDQFSGEEVDLPSQPKITCDGCKEIFKLCRLLRPSDFSVTSY